MAWRHSSVQLKLQNLSCASRRTLPFCPSSPQNHTPGAAKTKRVVKVLRKLGIKARGFIGLREENLAALEEAVEEGDFFLATLILQLIETEHAEHSAEGGGWWSKGLFGRVL
jgi:hypothetical protein